MVFLVLVQRVQLCFVQLVRVVQMLYLGGVQCLPPRTWVRR